MAWLDISSFGFLVIFLATTFLIGELLVKSKGIFGAIGILLMAFYFGHHIDGVSGLWVIILYVAGLALIIFDGKVISDGTVAIFGIVLMIIGVAVPTPDMVYGLLVTMGIILGGFSAALFLKVFPRRELWTKITLRDRLSGEEGYNSINEKYHELVGKEGKAITDFRPTGTIEIEGEAYSATSGGQWLKSGTKVTVDNVDGTRIVVRQKAGETESNE
ncbi:NfeD family protein [Salsuginibacillus kocurii]|uniref:NfeD family protein n=1 Tax=Salsuginibacillus kocurii TaxID=427078 RepID=UPI0003720032|nr:NfeD family protein [Salsuginibacillus kocurii]